MRRLILLRHAKSSWDDPGLDDFDRPLAPRGRAAAPLMAAYLREKDLVPDLVLCSTARRALQTWELVSPVLGGEVEVKYLNSLYLASPSRLITTLRRAPESAATVMMIGHNPGMEDTAAALAGPESKKKAIKKLAQKFPTAAVAQIDFEAANWGLIDRGGGRLVRLVYPKDLA